MSLRFLVIIHADKKDVALPAPEAVKIPFLTDLLQRAFRAGIPLQLHDQGGARFVEGDTSGMSSQQCFKPHRIKVQCWL